MKRFWLKATIVLGIFGLLSPLRAGTLPDFTAAIRCDLPTNFHERAYTSARMDPGDNPFSLEGPPVIQFVDYGNGRCGRTVLAFRIACAYVGNGKVMHYLPVTAASLKAAIESEYNKRFEKPFSATPCKIDGYDAVNLAAFQPPSGHYNYCWISIETNITLECTTTSCNAESFREMTNALQSIHIDKAKALELLKPSAPEWTTNEVDEIDVGTMRWRGTKAAAYILRLPTGILSFEVGGWGEDPQGAIDSRAETLNRMQQLSSDSTGTRIVTENVSRSGSGSADFSTTIGFLADSRADTIAEVMQNPPQPVLAGETWTNREPEGFEQVFRYRVKAILLRRFDDSSGERTIIFYPNESH